MGYMIILGRCLVCKRVFGYNPDKVPSHPARDGRPVEDPTAPNEPICENCIMMINGIRKELGEPQWTVYPDSYEPKEE